MNPSTDDLAPAGTGRARAAKRRPAPAKRAIDRLDGLLSGAVKTGLWVWVAMLVVLTVWVVVTSLKTNGEVFTDPFGLPKSPQWRNYRLAWSVSGFGQAAFSSVTVVAASALLTMVIATPAAYVLARVNRRSADRVITYFAIGMGIPAQALVVPFFLMSNDLSTFMTEWVTGWWDDRISLALIYVVLSLPFTVYLLTMYFRSLPTEIEEAAAVDGAGPTRTFVEIMVPLARHGLVTALVLNIVALWNETLFVLIVVGDPQQRTLPAALLELYNTMQYTSNWGGLFAGIVILVMPMILLYLWAGRRIVQAMTQGAIK
ncbi:carbohydrate ABC transporter permease [Catenulispora sp. NL8]|uniref:Carbohydrate ABC transporter permease n=1 Tax=Catenulispora pinistramenti TaxID=2705254 RepID=A0ABS5KJ16_9ACTN|nr:carbohydrate ABC transporter permease [Catenulispora pinistramenti]MBS2546377.1 carbohydrate ABC transporter permease [Catenulispora pinistramenti]